MLGDSLIENLPVAIQPNNLISSDLILSSYVLKDYPFTVDYANREIKVQTFDVRCRYKLHKAKELIDGFIVFS